MAIPILFQGLGEKKHRKLNSKLKKRIIHVKEKKIDMIPKPKKLPYNLLPFSLMS
jgi:hypothetical protein